jgi:hypothetical protein
MDFKQDIASVIHSNKGLEYSESENTLTGKLYISENDFYELKIFLAPYPNAFPDVKEIGERIPETADRHIYMDNTRFCCFTTKAISQILLRTKVKSVSDFINLIIIPYLENNSYYEINRHYVKDEFAHGAPGVLQGYKDILGISDDYKILKLLYDTTEGRFIKQSDRCYCGSSKSLKTCHNGKHYRNYNRFRMIDSNTLMGDTYGIMMYKKRD